LGRTHGVHAIRAAGLLPSEEPDNTVEAMAESALAALDAANIIPAAVLGWSLGGVVGWELCQRLAERGSLPDLVLVDSSPLPASDPDGSLRERVLKTLGPRPAAAAVQCVERTLEAQLMAARSYRAVQPYLGRVLMLMCTGEDATLRARTARRWRALAPSLWEGQLNSDHYGVFDEAHVPELAAQVAAFLGAPA
jgi:thioesterase domain-containing protein